MYFKLVVLSLVAIETVLATGSSYRCMMVANTAGLLMGIYGCHESGCTVPKKPSFGDRFDQYDANGDGQLSYAEMSSVANDMVPGKILLYMHIIQKAQETSNKMVHKRKETIFWPGFSYPFTWSVSSLPVLASKTLKWKLLIGYGRT